MTDIKIINHGIFHDIKIDAFECPHCNTILDIDKLLCKYGPEGLYELADMLKTIADEDIADSY